MSKPEIIFNGVESKVEKNGNVANITVGDEKLYVEKAKEAGIEKKTLETVAKFDEAYLNAAVENAVEKSEKVFLDDKDIEEIVVTTPFGINKSSKIHTQVKRAVTSPIPGTDKTVTKPRIKNVVNTNRYNVPKAKLKRLADSLNKKISNQ